MLSFHVAHARMSRRYRAVARAVRRGRPLGARGHHAVLLRGASAPGDCRLEPLEPRLLLSAGPTVVGWTAQGPGPILNGQVEGLGSQDGPVVGAIHTVAAHPVDADILYVGAVNGGIWKTADATAATPTWTPLTDFAASLSIGALAFDPTDPTHQTLVAGIGRTSSFGRMGGLQSGLLRTDDGGSTWQSLGASDPGGLDLAGRNISGVVARGSTLLAAANTLGDGADPGVYLSIDDGVTFQNISGLNGLGDGSVSDLVADPGDADRLYAAVLPTIDRGTGAITTAGGIFRTDDLGVTWTNVTGAAGAAINQAPTDPDGTGSFAGTNNIEMAVHSSGPVTNAVYAGVMFRGRNNGVFRSEAGVDGVNNDADAETDEPDETRFVAMDIPRTNESGESVGLQPREKPGGQGAIHFAIVADPTRPNIVYVGGDRQPQDDGSWPNSIGAEDYSGRLFRGDAAVAPTGAVPSPQWDHLTHSDSVGDIPGGGTANDTAPHADSREMVFDANGRLIEVDDGGIYRRTRPYDNGGDWRSLNGNLQVTELHDVAWDRNAGVIIGGAQDTGTPQQTAPGSVVWDSVQLADGGDVAVDNITLVGDDESIRYSSRQHLSGFQYEVYDADNDQVGGTVEPDLSLVGGGTPLVTGSDGNAPFVTPLALNAIDPTRLLIQATDALYESPDQGDTIREIGAGIGATTRQNALVYGGQLGAVANPDVLYAGSGGQVFVRTAAAGPVAATPTAFPGGTVRDIVLDPADWQDAYVSDSNNVYQTSDAGNTWTDITGDLIATGLRTLAYVPAAGFGAILAGAMDGVYATATTLLDGAATRWLRLGTDLPRALVWDFDYDAVDGLLLAGTMGRGVWTLADAAQAVTGQLSGTVWKDRDGDGIRGTGEGGRNNVTVRLMDPVDGVIDNHDDAHVATVTTNGSGHYRFEGVVPGDYYVAFVAPAEHAIAPRDQGTDDDRDSDADRITGFTGIVTALAGSVDDSIDAGLIVPDRFEQNDAFAAAVDLGVLPGVHLEHLTISAPGDDDWYRLELLRPDDVDIAIDFTHAFGNLDLEVTDAGGTVLGSSTGSADTEQVSLTGLAAGTYYVHVLGPAGAVNVYDMAMDPGPTSSTRVIYVNNGSTSNDYYTLATGSNGNDGFTPNDPKATVQNVLGTYDLGANDLVVIDTGGYGATVTLAKDDEGAAYAGTPFTGPGSGGGSSFTDSGTRWELIDADFNIIFKVTYGGSNHGYGVRLHSDGVDPSTNNLIRDSYFPGTSWAIWLQEGEDDRVLDNIVTDSGSYGVRVDDAIRPVVRDNAVSGRTDAVYVVDAVDPLVEANDLASGTRGVYILGETAGALVQGNLVDGFTDRGILATSRTTSTLQGNTVLSSSIGIEAQTANAPILDNDVRGNVVGIKSYGVVGAADWASGLENVLEGNATGIWARSGSTVRFNRIQGGATAVHVPENNVDIHHNVIYRFTGQGIRLADGDHVTLHSNTIYTPSGNGVRLENFSSHVGLRNNVIWTEDGFDISVATDSQIGFASDYNNLFTTGAGQVVWWQKPFADLFDWQVEADYDNHSIGYTAPAPSLDDPRFVDRANDDYHLTDLASTSIDAGDPASLFANEPAPAGARINLGAYGDTTEAALSRDAYIRIESPQFYTDLEADVGQVVLWHTFDAAQVDKLVTGDVDIDLIEVNPATGAAIGKVADIAVVPAGDGSVAWTPATLGIAGDITRRYRVRVASLDPIYAPHLVEASREPFAIVPHGNAFYVDDLDDTDDQYTPAATGDNRQTGQSPADPKANLLPMLRSYDLRPGDTVYIDTGDYLHVRNTIISGTPAVGGDDEGATYTGPDPALPNGHRDKVARIDRANPYPGSTNIDVNDGDYVVVRHLTVTGAEMGLWVRNGSTNFSGTDLVLEGNVQDGIRLESDAEAATVDRLTAFNNGRDGIAIATSIDTLSDSTAYANTRYGIHVTGPGTHVTANHVYANGSHGIYAYATHSAPAIFVELNDVHDNLSYGIHAQNHVVVRQNVVHGHTTDNNVGIYVAGATATQNVVYDNFDGILGKHNTSNTITNNRVYLSARYGITARNASIVKGNVSYSNATGVRIFAHGYFTGAVTHNLVYANSVDGIVIDRAGSGGRVASNTVYQANGDALRVQGSSQHIAVRDNILWSTSATGHAIHVADNSQTGFDGDYNLFFLEDPTTGVETGRIGYWQGASRPTLAGWRSATFDDGNSLLSDPAFVDPDGIDDVFGYVDATRDGRDDNFHLMSTEGRFTGSLAPVLNGASGLPDFLPVVELADDAQSPAIDRGDAASAFDLEPTPNGGFVNIGTYGNTVQASKSPPEYVLVTRPDGGEVWPAEQTFPVRWRTEPTIIPGTEAAYRSAVLADTPVGYWRLGEAPLDTTAVNETGNAILDGTYGGGVTLGQAGFLPGNDAAGFDGDDDGVVVGDDPALGPASLSVEAWVRPDAAIGQYDAVIMKSTSSSWNDGFGLFHQAGGELRFFINHYSRSFAHATVELNVYSHVVGTYDGSTIDLYVNGALADSVPFSDPISHSTGDLLIGRGTPSYVWTGDLDEVAFYDTALTADQVSTHHNLGPAGRGLVDIDLVDGSLGAVVETIATGAANDGERPWSIPNSIPADTDYRVRITHTTTGQSDESNADFEITPPISIYYVNDDTVLPGDWTSNPGDLANDGLSPATPKDSIRGVLEEYELDPGDIIKVDNGTYPVASNILITDADPGIIIEGYHDAGFPDGKAVLDRGNALQDVFEVTADQVTFSHVHITGGRDGIHVIDGDDVSVEHSEFFANERYGVYLDAASERARIEENDFDGVAMVQDYGLYALGPDATITANQAFDHRNRGIYVTGDRATVQVNEAWDNQQYGIEVYGSSRAMVAGNISHGNNSYGIYVYGVHSEAQATVDENRTYDNASHGLYVNGNVLARGNTSYGQSNSNTYGIYVAAGAIADRNIAHTNYDGIYGHHNGSVTITNNDVYNNVRYGIAARNGSVITGNASYHNATGIQILSYNEFTGTVANNLVHGNGTDGIVIERAGSGGTVSNNTVFQESGDALRVQGASSFLVVRNNILWATAGYALRVGNNSQTGFDSDFNLFYMTDPVSGLETGRLGWWEGVDFASRADWFFELGLDGNSLVADPEFLDLVGNDFHLLPTSPGVDLGDLASPFANEPTPNGGRINVGRYGNTVDATMSPDELVQVLDPNGLEKFEVGGEMTVRWHTDGIPTQPADVAYGLTILEQGPIAYYHLGEAAGGTAFDASGAPVLNGSYLDGPALGAQGAFGVGLDTAVDLDGIDDYVQATDPGDLDLRRQVSFSFWLNPASFTNTWSPLIHKGNGSTNGRTYSMWLQSNGSLLVDSSDAIGRQYLQTPAGAITTGQWYHVAGVIDRDAGRMSIHVDGAVAASTAYLRTNDTLSNGQPLRIGWANEVSSSYAPFNGVIDEVAIFPAALSQDQIASQASPPPYTYVDVDLLDAGSMARVETIATNHLGPGALRWTIPGSVTLEAEYLVRVTATDGSQPSDVSNEPFVITNDGRNYYVNDATVLADDWTTAPGDNRKSGKSDAAPMASLRGLLAAYDLDPGDRIHVDNGDYRVIKTIEVEALDHDGITIAGYHNLAYPARRALLDRGNTLQNAFTVRAADVDLTHLEIIGARDGIHAAGARDLTVAHSRFSGNDRYGIYLNADSPNALIEHNVFDGEETLQDYGIYALGADLTANENFAFEHRTRGIYVSGDRAIVQYNHVYDNAVYGLEITGSSGAAVDYNRVYGNGSYGIVVTGYHSEARTSVSHNIAHGNQSYGIYVSGSVTALHNTSYDHQNTNNIGIYVSNGAIVDRNTVYGNFDGIHGHANTSNTIINNTVYHNARYGIVARNASVISSNRSYSNSIGIQILRNSGFTGQVSHNLVYANANHGIVINHARSGGVVANNTVFQEIGDALRVKEDSQNLLVRNNILWVTSGYDIYVENDSQTGFDSDHNLLHTTLTGKLGSWNGVDFTDRADWFYEVGTDRNSLAGDPQFVLMAGPDGSLGYDGDAGIDYGGDDDFHLMADSPAIDLGDLDFPFFNEPPPNGARINAGRYGNTTEAAFSPEQGMQVVAPNGFEKYEVGQELTLRWHTTGPHTEPTDDSYALTVQDHGPIAYYRMGEAAGTTAFDASGAPLLNGSYRGSPSLNMQGVFGPGLDTTVTLDGLDDYIEVADPGDLDLRRQVSFSFWLRPDAFTNTWSPLIHKGAGTSSTRTYAMWLHSSGYLMMDSADASGRQYLQTASGLIRTGLWHHVAGVIDRDTGQMSIHVNGEVAKSMSSLRTNDTVSHSEALRIGWTSETNTAFSPFAGAIDEVAIFDHALSPEQIGMQWRNPPHAYVDIDVLDADTSVPVHNIATSQLLPDRFQWRVPSDLTLEDTYLIRVRATQGTQPVDVSNEPFLVTNDGTDYYVNDATVLPGDGTTVAGDNAASGKLRGAPMASLRALLLAYDLDPDDVIHVDNGDYDVINNVFVSSADAGVHIEGYHDPDRPTRRALLDRNNTTRHVVEVEAADVQLSHLHLTDGRDGVHARNADDLIVVEGHITSNVRYGIFLNVDTENALIDRNVIDGDGAGDYGIYALGPAPTITGNRTFSNDYDGIYANQDGATVTGNEVSDNGRRGIWVDWSAGALISENIVHHNQSYGIYTTGSSSEAQVTVSGNTSFGNASEGIYATSNVLATGNTVYSNPTGIYLSSGAVADRNIVHGNVDGIEGARTSSNTVANNIVYNNSGHGIIAYHHSTIAGNRIYSNSIGIQTRAYYDFTGPIENNLVYANTNQGIVVERAGAGSTVTNNTIFQEVGDAIRIRNSSQDLRIRNNILWVAAGYDIYVDPDSQAGLDSDYNLFHQGVDPRAHVGYYAGADHDLLIDWHTATGLDLFSDDGNPANDHSLEGNPLFADANGADNVLGFISTGDGYNGGGDDNFKLIAHSPAIDRADSWAAPRFDIDGVPRRDDPGSPNLGTDDYTEIILATSDFSVTGLPRGWQSNDRAWTLNFAGGFTFPFYGVTYSSVAVSSNGFLQLGGSTNATDPSNTIDELTRYTRIAPLWDDLTTAGVDDDIFVDESMPGEVTIRWDATNVVDGSDVNVAVTLLAGGEIAFHYGPGNTGLTPTIGLSQGGGRNLLLSTYDGSGSLTEVETAHFGLVPGHADIGAYEFRGSSTDTDPPTVLATVPAEVEAEGTVTTAFDRIEVVFSEPVDHIEALATANWDLRGPGDNGSYEPGGDDVVVDLDPNHVAGSDRVTLNIVGGALPDGPYRLTISGDSSIRDLAGNRLDGDDDGGQGGDYVRFFDADSTPPRVEQVLVLGSAWTVTFLDHLEATGAGAGGYAIPDGGPAQLAPLSWIDIDRLMIRFSKNVTITDDPDLIGVNGSYALTDRRYDGGTFTATWSLATPIGPDKLLVHLPDTVQDDVGRRLAGGDFTFRFNALPGDINRDTVTSIRDVGAMRAPAGTVAGDDFYDVMADLNGDSAVNGIDAGQLRSRIGVRLPAAEPVLPASGAGVSALLGAPLAGARRQLLAAVKAAIPLDAGVLSGPDRDGGSSTLDRWTRRANGCVDRWLERIGLRDDPGRDGVGTP